MTAKPPVQPRRRGRPKLADAPERKQEILQVATELFLSRGYREVTTRLVAEAAGVSRQTLFNLYTDKAQLFRACLDFASPIYPGSTINSDAEPTVELPRFATDLIGWLSRKNSVGFSRLLLIDGRNLPELAAVAEENQNAHFIAPLATYLAKWNLERPGSDANARIFVAMAIAQWNQALSFGHPLPDEDETHHHAARITDIFLRGAGEQTS